MQKKIRKAEISKEEVYKQEKITNHDLASFVDILQKKVGEGSNWVHYGLTSSDIVDSANSLLIIPVSYTHLTLPTTPYV